MRELGPLRFGANPSAQLVAVDQASVPVKAATVAGPTGTYSFTMTLGNSGDAQRRLQFIYILSSSGGTANINWGNGSSGVITLVKNINYGINTPSTGSRVTISGRNAANIYFLGIRNGYTSITGITGTYPSTLTSLDIAFGYENATFTIPNTLTSLSFLGEMGPSSITTPPTLKTLTYLPPNTTRLDLSKSPLITSLPSNLKDLTNLTMLYTPLGLTTLTGSQLPPSLLYLFTDASKKLVSIGDISNLTKLTSLGLANLDKFTSLGKLPTSCTLLNLYNCPLFKNIKLDPSIIKTADLRKTGIVKPGLLLLPSDCNYIFD